MIIKYKDRIDAGYKLAESLRKESKNRKISLTKENCVILAIPNGGIIPAYAVAKELNIKMNLIVVGKLKIPGTDIGIGSITIDGNSVLNEAMINRYRLTKEKINEIERYELDKMITKLETYDIAQIDLKKLSDKYVIIIDEGSKTGYSMIAAIKSVNLIAAPKIIIVALPAASAHAIIQINRFSRHIVCHNIIDSISYNFSDSYEHYHSLEAKDVLKYIEKIKEEDLLFT